MKLTKILFSVFAIALLSFGLAGAQTAVEGFSFGENEGLPVRSGAPTPLTVSASDVSWSGSGPATFSFNSSQRGTAWVIIYEKGNNETGRRGPGGAWQRLVPQDLYVTTVPASGQAIESGNNSIVWDGRDFEGNAAGAGNYEFDLVVVNNLDDLVVVGPGSGPSGFTWPNIDLTKDPVEIFAQEYERSVPDRGHAIGDMIRGTIGTNYLTNPTAWERWSYNNVMNWEGARTASGLRQDDVDPDIYWSNDYTAECCKGIYKMTINRAAQSWEAVTDFGENGRSVNVNGDRILQFKPEGDVIWQTLHGVQEVPFSAIEQRDKATGATLTEFDVGDFYHVTSTDDEGNESTRSGGPRQIDVVGNTIVTSAWGHQAILGVDKNSGEVRWVNDNGDGYGDRLDQEGAAAIGGIASPAINITGSTIDPGSGNIALFNMVGVNGPTTWGVVGRDGTGIFSISYPIAWGRGRPGGTRFNMINHGSAYDGLYSNIGLNLVALEAGVHYGNTPEGRYGPKMLSHTPYEVFSGRLGGSVTAVSANESAGTPDSYTLGDAYPNPFNPQTSVEFAVPSDGLVKIEIFNSVGQVVSSIVDQDLSAGAYTATWDAVDSSGNQVSSGVYFYRMEAGDFTATRSMTLLK